MVTIIPKTEASEAKLSRLSKLLAPSITSIAQAIETADAIKDFAEQAILDDRAARVWQCDWTPDDLNPGPECPYCAGQMCARFDGLHCTHNRIERHG